MNTHAHTDDIKTKEQAESGNWLRSINELPTGFKVFRIAKDGCIISTQKVMCSAAGHYIGKSCLDPGVDYTEVPYSRDSEYDTMDACAALLRAWNEPIEAPPLELPEELPESRDFDDLSVMAITNTLGKIVDVFKPNKSSAASDDFKSGGTPGLSKSLFTKYRLYPDGRIYHEDDFHECDPNYDDYAEYDVLDAIAEFIEDQCKEEILSFIRTDI